MANSSDVLREGAASPTGIVGVLAGGATITYTPTDNVKVVITLGDAGTGSSNNITVNGAIVLAPPATSSASPPTNRVEFYVRKGQTATIVQTIPGATSVLVSAQKVY